MEFIGQTILNGLMTGSFYALIAVGLSLVFGVMHSVNFAHGYTNFRQPPARLRCRSS